MAIPNGAIGQTSRRHSHRTPADADRCPLCGSPIRTAAVRQRIEERLRAQVAGAEQNLRDEFARQQQQAEAKKQTEIQAARRDGARSAELQLAALRAQQETVINQRVQAACAESEKRLAEAVAAEKQRAYGEKLALEQQLSDMQRRLQARPAHQIGEPAELSVHQAIVSVLPPTDKVERVGKGVKGADVIVTITADVSGEEAGKILVESKAHARWSNKFVSKLKEDLREAGAIYGIVSTAVMPAGCSELCVQDGIIIASPQRVPALCQLLRQQILDSHRLALTTADRDEKAARLLSYIGSRECAESLEKVGTLTSAMQDLDAKEVSSHDAVWKRRGDLIRDLQAVNAELAGVINRILSGNDPEALR